MATLTSAEILADVIQAFAKQFPALNRMGTDFRPGALKLNQTYTAHIPTLPSVEDYDVSTGYDTTGNLARSLLVDVPITVDAHKHVKLKWKHLDALKDKKNRYGEVIGLAGYALAKAAIDNLLAAVTIQNFSQGTVSAAADFDLDVIQSVCGSMNGLGALPTGRVLLVNTAVANVIAADTRISSSEQYGQREGGNALRSWKNVGGFAEIIEYPDLPTNNGEALACTIEADDEVVTTTDDHGLVVGDRVIFPALTGGTGLTAATVVYYVKTAPTAKTLTVSATPGGAAVNVTADATSGSTIKKAENMIGFAFDRRAFALLSGIPENFDSEFLAQLNIPRVMGFESITDPTTGISMAAVSWQEKGTGDLVWAPTFVFGKALGRQGASNAAGAKCDYAGHIIRTL